MYSKKTYDIVRYDLYIWINIEYHKNKKHLNTW